MKKQVKMLVYFVLAAITLLDSRSAWSQERSTPMSARSVTSLWQNYDPRADPLETKVVREWQEDGMVFRYVTFHIGTFKGKKARMAGFYGFPKNGKNLPALLHIHGGGQRAFLHEVIFYAKRGYACLSVNWGGREMENAKPDDPNTDWGSVDPTQKNVPGYFNLKPGKLYLDDFESPRNNNWYLLTIGCRRGLTFLEQQPEVDADRMGVYGHSMGGNLTVYVAGTDNRIKVAAPSVGGQGFRTFAWQHMPQQITRRPNGDVELFRATLGFQSYAPHIKAPLLWLGATNDFHGVMDDTYRTGALVQNQPVRYAFTPHMNHRFTPEFAATRPLWLDQHLKEAIKIPDTPKTKLVITENAIPQLQVMPDRKLPIEKVEIFYSLDPHQIARYWRSALVKRTKNGWSASLPLLSAKQPLFAYANVYYRLKTPVEVPFALPSNTFALSSFLQTTTAKELKQANVKISDQPALVIEDFSRGFQDWYRLSPENPKHWQYWTRKVNDPKWQGKPNYRLALDVEVSHPNPLAVVMTENFFRSYRGKQKDFVAVVSLRKGRNSLVLGPGDFRDSEGRPLKSWGEVDLLGIRAKHDTEGEMKRPSPEWNGAQPILRKIYWVTE